MDGGQRRSLPRRIFFSLQFYTSKAEAKLRERERERERERDRGDLVFERDKRIFLFKQ